MNKLIAATLFSLASGVHAADYTECAEMLRNTLRGGADGANRLDTGPNYFSIRPNGKIKTSTAVLSYEKRGPKEVIIGWLRDPLDNYTERENRYVATFTRDDNGQIKKIVEDISAHIHRQKKKIRAAIKKKKGPVGHLPDLITGSEINFEIKNGHCVPTHGSETISTLTGKDLKVSGKTARTFDTKLCRDIWKYFQENPPVRVCSFKEMKTTNELEKIFHKHNYAPSLNRRLQLYDDPSLRAYWDHQYAPNLSTRIEKGLMTVGSIATANNVLKDCVVHRDLGSIIKNEDIWKKAPPAESDAPKKDSGRAR